MKTGKHFRLWLSVGVAAIFLIVLLAPVQVQAVDGCWSHDEIGFQYMSGSGHTAEVYGGDPDVPEQWNSAYQIQGEPFGSRLLQQGEGLWEELKVKLRGGPDDLSYRNCGNTLRDSKSLFADKGRVASYQMEALARKLALEDAYGPYYLVIYNSTGRNRQRAGDTGLFVRY